MRDFGLSGVTMSDVRIAYKEGVQNDVVCLPASQPANQPVFCVHYFFFTACSGAGPYPLMQEV